MCTSSCLQLAGGLCPPLGCFRCITWLLSVTGLLPVRATHKLVERNHSTILQVCEMAAPSFEVQRRNALARRQLLREADQYINWVNYITVFTMAVLCGLVFWLVWRYAHLQHMQTDSVSSNTSASLTSRTPLAAPAAARLRRIPRRLTSSMPGLSGSAPAPAPLRGMPLHHIAPPKCCWHTRHMHACVHAQLASALGRLQNKRDCWPCRGTGGGIPGDVCGGEGPE